ncbi:hypothetical protein ACIQ1J_07630 [Streptomyces sp. NPDC097107]|uniref:hypothetical protein n=1 Tax=Streptomyces sp. NPDC097107 TaxID=3366089 RepID=UPI00381F53C5
MSLQLWILRAASDGSAAAPPSQDALLVNATRFARLDGLWDRLNDLRDEMRRDLGVTERVQGPSR